MNNVPLPNIILEESDVSPVFIKPIFVSLKNPHKLGITGRPGRSRSDPNLFSDITFLSPPLENDENKENQSSPTTTPTKFLKKLIPPSSVSPSPSEASPTHLPRLMGNMVLTAVSPTKLSVSPSTLTPAEEPGTPSPTYVRSRVPRMVRVESEHGRKLLGKSQSNGFLVEEALTQIRATVSPRKKMFLPTLLNTSQPELNCLSSLTVAQLIDGKFDNIYSKVVILDCRFEYEYVGGHIKGALNFAKEEDLDNAFTKCDQYHHHGDKLCLVFHCEFSSHRAPKAYKRIRSWDRKRHENCYPKLIFPEMYLLEGGYKKFFEECPDWCEPRDYVEMKDHSYASECRLALMGGCGRAKSCRRYFSRSCTNVFGDLSVPISGTSMTPGHGTRGGEGGPGLRGSPLPKKSDKDSEIETDN